jgi:DNA invertase Pin-like site-specific DNA recombinase
MTMAKRFAFYGRVSTEDQQDPESSKAWQLSRASQLIESHGEVVAEYFDIGQSRSLPWKRRPEASRLLEDIRRRDDRPFDAVVIGEPARAFYGQQFGLTFPTLVHYGVELWVPEVGGRVDPDSEAHDLVMSLYGGMSKGERNRIKVRVRTAMASQAATEGRYLGGRPPFGYRLADAGAHPNPAKAADGKRSHRLEPDPMAAPVVRRIFAEYLDGYGLRSIAEGLTADGIASPSAHDPARNRHRQHSGGAWAHSAVRAILHNPRYTGHQVWARQRKDEDLVDPDDVALGHRTRMRWNTKDKWIWSDGPTHEALVDLATFERVQAIMASHVRVARPKTLMPTERAYLLRGLMFCGLCGRRMAGAFNHGHPQYKCSFRDQYAQKAGLEHPPTVYLREDKVVPALDEWLAQLFDPDHIDDTCAQLAAVYESHDDDERADQARQTIAECDRKLARHRAALEAGADPTIVAGWMSEVTAERQRADQALRTATPGDAPTPAQMRAVIEGLGDMITVLADADPAQRAKLYEALGLRLTWHPQDKKVLVEAQLARVPAGRVGGA